MKYLKSKKCLIIACDDFLVRFLSVDDFNKHILEPVRMSSWGNTLKLSICRTEKILVAGCWQGYIAIFSVEKLFEGDPYPIDFYWSHNKDITGLEIIIGKSDLIILSCGQDSKVIARSFREKCVVFTFKNENFLPTHIIADQDR